MTKVLRVGIIGAGTQSGWAKESHVLVVQKLRGLELEAVATHDQRIAVLEQNAVAWQRRAQATERQYKERVEELETELEMFNHLNNTIHGIATQQLERQPDPEPQEVQPLMSHKPKVNDDADRAQVLAILAEARIKPYEGGEEDDDTESYNGEEDDEEE